MRVLIVGQYFEPSFKAGGPIRSLRGFVRLIHELDWEPTVITSFIDLDGQHNGGTEAPSVQKWKLTGLVKGIFQADLIIINSVFSPKFSIAPLFIGLIFKRRMLLVPRGELYETALNSGKRRAKWVYTLFLNIVKKAFYMGATSVDEFASLERRGFKVKHIPNLRFDLLEERMKKKGGSNSVYGILGRVSLLKNQEFVYKVWTRDWGTLIIQGPQDEGISLLSDLERGIEVVEGTNDTSDFFDRIDVLIVPSLSENYCHSAHEGGVFGSVLLSADSLRIGLKSHTFRNNDHLSFRNAVEAINQLEDADFERLREETRTQTLRKLSNDINVAKDTIRFLVK